MSAGATNLHHVVGSKGRRPVEQRLPDVINQIGVHAALNGLNDGVGVLPEKRSRSTFEGMRTRARAVAAAAVEKRPGRMNVPCS